MGLWRTVRKMSTTMVELMTKRWGQVPQAMLVPSFPPHRSTLTCYCA